MDLYAQAGQRLAGVCITHFNVHTLMQLSLFKSSKCDVTTTDTLRDEGSAISPIWMISFSWFSLLRCRWPRTAAGHFPSLRAGSPSSPHIA